MKHYLSSLVLLFLAVVLLCGCATAEERAARAALQAAKVKKALSEKRFMINVDYMYPLSGTPKHLSYGYSLEVRNDSLISYLPYFGRAFNVPYGGGKALNFSERIGSYHEQEKGNGQRHIEIGVRNEEDTYTYYIDVFDNGSSSIDVQARERDVISFSGMMTFDE